MDRLFKYGVGGIFFLLPLFFLLPPYATTFEQQISGAKLIYIFFFGNLFLGAYLAHSIHWSFGLIHSAISASVVLTGFGAVQIYPYAYWVAGVGFTLFFLHLEEDWQEFLLKCVVWSAVASSVLALFQALDMDPLMTYASHISRADRTNPIGMLGQTTKFGAFLAMAFGLALAFRQWFAAVVIGLAAISTDSSFTWLALGGAFLVNLRYLMGRAIVVVLVLAGGASVWTYKYLYDKASSMADNGRFAVWEATIRAWWEHSFWLGFGPGSFQALFSTHFQPKWLLWGSFEQAHNDYLQVVFEMGIIGIIVMVACITIVAIHFKSSWWGGKTESSVVVAAEGALAAILLNAIGNFPFQLAPHFLLGIISFATIVRATQGRDGYQFGSNGPFYPRGHS